MKLSEIAQLRLHTQHINSNRYKNVKELVASMGAMHAQDFAMCKWAIGIRMPKLSLAEIENSLRNAEIIRTHVMRPTWHIVSAENIRWMLELTSPYIKSSMKSRWKELGLNEKIVSKCHSIFEKILAGNNHQTREELISQLEKAKIATSDQRAAHLIVNAELDQLICSGITKENKITYALFEERVPSKKPLKKEEALYSLASIYFNSHGPATMQDFSWWSGISLTDSKKAMELVKDNCIQTKIDDAVYFQSKTLSIPQFKESLYLLPAYDEFLISYKERKASLLTLHQKVTITTNGIFKPIIVENGQVTGVWSRTFKKDRVQIKPVFFKAPKARSKELLEVAAKQYAAFLGMKPDIQ